MTGLVNKGWTSVRKYKWFSYPTSGSEEAIREVMLHIKEVKNAEHIYVLPGEYEGYEAVAGTRGLPVLQIDPEELLEAIPGWVFISNPSSRNGNVISPDYIQGLLDHGHMLVIDLAYLGTADVKIDVSHPNIYAVLTSFSKPFGMFYYRVGFAFTRELIPSLDANRKWFKCVPSLMAAEAVVDKVSRAELLSEMKVMQSDVLTWIKDETGVHLNRSDSWLIAHLYPDDACFLPPDKYNAVALFRRGPFYRFCLTPSLETTREL